MAVLIESYKQTEAFRPEKFNPVMLALNARVKVIQACFEPGQFIPVHQPGVDLTLVVLEGSGTLVADDRELHIVPGALAFIPAGESRGIKADTRLVVLHVVTPPPSDADHAQVVAGLQKGAWR
ncbi:MAG: cupin [Anaerolineae bacterium]|nr:cupin [Anaerolineae bacterium]